MKKSEILFLYETSYNIPNGVHLQENNVTMRKRRKSLLVMFELKDLFVHTLRISKVNTSMSQTRLELTKKILKVY